MARAASSPLNMAAICAGVRPLPCPTGASGSGAAWCEHSVVVVGPPFGDEVGVGVPNANSNVAASLRAAAAWTAVHPFALHCHGSAPAATSAAATGTLPLRTARRSGGSHSAYASPPAGAPAASKLRTSSVVRAAGGNDATRARIGAHPRAAVRSTAAVDADAAGGGGVGQTPAVSRAERAPTGLRDDRAARNADPSTSGSIGVPPAALAQLPSVASACICPQAAATASGVAPKPSAAHRAVGSSGRAPPQLPRAEHRARADPASPSYAAQCNGVQPLTSRCVSHRTRDAGEGSASTVAEKARREVCMGCNASPTPVPGRGTTSTRAAFHTGAGPASSKSERPRVDSPVPISMSCKMQSAATSVRIASRSSRNENESAGSRSEVVAPAPTFTVTLADAPAHE